MALAAQLWPFDVVFPACMPRSVASLAPCPDVYIVAIVVGLRDPRRCPLQRAAASASHLLWPPLLFARIRVWLRGVGPLSACHGTCIGGCPLGHCKDPRSCTDYLASQRFKFAPVDQTSRRHGVKAKWSSPKLTCISRKDVPRCSALQQDSDCKTPRKDRKTQDCKTP